VVPKRVTRNGLLFVRPIRGSLRRTVLHRDKNAETQARGMAVPHVQRFYSGRRVACNRSPANQTRAHGLCNAKRARGLGAYNGVLFAGYSEPPRVLRRLQHLREWSHEQVKQVFT